MKASLNNRFAYICWYDSVMVHQVTDLQELVVVDGAPLQIARINYFGGLTKRAKGVHEGGKVSNLRPFGGRLGVGVQYTLPGA